VVVGHSLLWAYVAEHIQLLLVVSSHAFFLSGCAVETREFRGTASVPLKKFVNVSDAARTRSFRHSQLLRGTKCECGGV
jgi:hypothetical protein